MGGSSREGVRSRPLAGACIVSGAVVHVVRSQLGRLEEIFPLSSREESKGTRRTDITGKTMAD